VTNPWIERPAGWAVAKLHCIVEVLSIFSIMVSCGRRHVFLHQR